MNFWNAFPFVRFAIVLILGILLQDLRHFTLPEIYWMGGLILCLYLCLLVIANKTGFRTLNILHGLCGLLAIGILGCWVYCLKFQTYANNHYSRFTGIKSFTGTIEQLVKSSTNFDTYMLKVSHLHAHEIHHVSGLIYLNIRNSKDSLHLRSGDEVLVKKPIYSISTPKNPGVFDYRKYLSRRHIYGQTYANRQEIDLLNHRRPSLLSRYIRRIQQGIQHSFERHLSSEEERGILIALLIGKRDFLDPDIQQTYASAGAMHILAVSGLHVGIIYLILQSLLGKMKARGQAGRYAFTSTAIVSIWLYACAAGLSPSVSRASLMFTILLMSELFQRQTNVYNSLGVAAFLLLLIDPALVFSVGFQLSFLAVFGIVYLFPLLRHKFSSRYYIIDQIWQISVVSIAAQVATAPLSIYYFHQFPNYFLLTNLVAIPVAYLLVSGGIILYVFSLFSTVIGDLLGEILQQLIACANSAMLWVTKLPYSTTDAIFLQYQEVLLIYALLVFGLATHHYSSFKIFALSFLCFVGLMSYRTVKHIETAKQQYILIYSHRDKVLIENVSGFSSQLFCTDSISEADRHFIIEPHQLVAGVDKQPSHKQIENKLPQVDNISYEIIGTKKFLFFNGILNKVQIVEPINATYLVINNEAVKNLDWMLKNFWVDTVILGHHNSFRYRKWFKKQATERGLHIQDINDRYIKIEKNYDYFYSRKC